MQINSDLDFGQLMIDFHWDFLNNNLILIVYWIQVSFFNRDFTQSFKHLQVKPCPEIGAVCFTKEFKLSLTFFSKNTVYNKIAMKPFFLKILGHFQ